MHGLLALGQSHLSFGETLDARRSHEAKHRVVAIRGVNNLIARGDWNATENDVILVTLYTLMFACSYSGDSIFEFFTLGRACGNVTLRLNKYPKSSVLVPGAGEVQDFVIGFKDKLQPHRIDQKPVSDALTSLDSLKSLHMNDVEVQLLQLMTTTIQLLRYWDIKGELGAGRFTPVTNDG